MGRRASRTACFSQRELLVLEVTDKTLGNCWARCVQMQWRDPCSSTVDGGFKAAAVPVALVPFPAGFGASHTRIFPFSLPASAHLDQFLPQLPHSSFPCLQNPQFLQSPLYPLLPHISHIPLPSQWPPEASQRAFALNWPVRPPLLVFSSAPSPLLLALPSALVPLRLPSLLSLPGSRSVVSRPLTLPDPRRMSMVS